MRYLQSLLREIGADLPARPPRQRQRQGGPGIRGGPRAHAALRTRGRPPGGPREPVLARAQPRRGGVPARAGGQEPVRQEAQVFAPPPPLVLLQAPRPGRCGARSSRRTPRVRPSWPAPRENVALVDAIIDDGFAFTELSIAEFDFNAFLSSNKRYRLPADVFFEMYSGSCSRRRSAGCARTTAASRREWPVTCRACPRSSSRPRPASSR